MSKYNTGGEQVEERKPYVSAYLDHSTVVIGAIQKAEYFTSSQKGTPGIRIHFFETEPTEGLKNGYCKVPGFEAHKTCINEFWLTENAMKASNPGGATKFFKLLVERVKGLEFVDEWENKAGTATSDEDYCQIVEDYFGGLEFAGLIASNVYFKEENGEVVEKDKSCLAFLGTFARKVTERAELDAIVATGKPIRYVPKKPETIAAPIVESTDNLFD